MIHAPAGTIAPPALRPRRRSRTLRRLVDTKWLLGLAVLVLLCKNPCAIYLAFHRSYKIAYLAAIVIIFMDYLIVRSRGGNIRVGSVVGSRLYGVFFYLSLGVVLLDGLISQQIDVEKTVQFVLNISQFFFILYAMMRFADPLRVVNAMYRVAVVLAALSLVMVAGNYAGTFPFPLTKVWLQGDNNLPTFFYFPFGIAHQILPTNPVDFRSYSYFTEPAHFAMFLIPFTFYAFQRARITKNVKHVLALGVLSIAAVFTISVAGLVSTWIALAGVCVCGLWGRPAARSTHAIGLVLLVGLAFCGALLWTALQTGSDDPRLRHLVMAVEDRQMQWSTGMDYAANHIFGEGIGYSQPEQVYWRAVRRRDTYGEFTNILESVYYLGLIYLIPLSLLLVGTGRYVFGGFFSKSGATRTLAAMMLFLLIYNGSSQCFFTGIFSLMLAAYVLILMQERAARSFRATPAARFGMFHASPFITGPITSATTAPQ